MQDDFQAWQLMIKTEIQYRADFVWSLGVCCDFKIAVFNNFMSFHSNNKFSLFAE